MTKPVNIADRVDEAPPRMVTFLSALQHFGVISIFLTYPLISRRQRRGALAFQALKVPITWAEAA
jgi:hypothetical protein